MNFEFIILEIMKTYNLYLSNRSNELLSIKKSKITKHKKSIIRETKNGTTYKYRDYTNDESKIEHNKLIVKTAKQYLSLPATAIYLDTAALNTSKAFNNIINEYSKCPNYDFKEYYNIKKINPNSKLYVYKKIGKCAKKMIKKNHSPNLIYLEFTSAMMNNTIKEINQVLLNNNNTTIVFGITISWRRKNSSVRKIKTMLTKTFHKYSFEREIIKENKHRGMLFMLYVLTA